MDEQPASGLPSIFDDGEAYDLVLKIFKHEMALLLRVAGFARWEICGDFDGALVRENDAMIVTAWNA